MVYDNINENEDTTEILVPCECGTHLVKISALDYNHTNVEFYVSFYSDDFYNQDGLLSRLWKRVKLAFKILCGKSYLLNDIVLSKDDVIDLKDRLEKIIERGEN